MASKRGRSRGPAGTALRIASSPHASPDLSRVAPGTILPNETGQDSRDDGTPKPAPSPLRDGPITALRRGHDLKRKDRTMEASIVQKDDSLQEAGEVSQTFFVAPNGDDIRGDGTMEHPFA